MPTYLTEPFEQQSYGLGYPQPYPFGFPEGLPHNAFSQVLESSHVVFAGQGRLLGIVASNTKNAGQFIQLFDATSLPANGAIPLLSVDIASATAKGVAYDPYGRWFDRGCVVANSTTQASLTIGAADTFFDAQYIPQVI